MGFITSFIIIMIFGFISHPLYKRIRPKHKGFIAYYSALVIGIPLLVDILFYVGALNFIFPVMNKLPWIAPNPILNGKDFMWNAFRFFGLDLHVQYNSALDAIAVILFLSYGPWYVLAKDGSRMFFGQKYYQGGYWWVLKPLRKPKTYNKLDKN